MRTSGRTDSSPAWPVYRGQAQGRENMGKGAKRPRARTLPVSLPLFSSHLLGQHALRPRGCLFLYFLSKAEL